MQPPPQAAGLVVVVAQSLCMIAVSTHGSVQVTATILVFLLGAMQLLLDAVQRPMA
ncbi:MAG: hypothetical protein QM820_47040 [Minicystis sp.]